MRKGVFALGLALFVALVLSNPCLADQDPNDPYGPDSVLFRSRDLLVPCPPEAGQTVVPLYFRNDTPFIGLRVPLTWSGPVELDSVSFLGSRISYLYNKQANIDQANHRVLVSASCGNQQPIPEGRGMLAKFYFSTADTGFLMIDTLSGPPDHLSFVREDLVTYTPQYQQGQFHLVCERDPNDPQAADTISFYPAYAYYPLPSGPGLFYAHVRASCDDSVGAMMLPLAWSGPVDFDSLTLRETVFADSIRIFNLWETDSSQTLAILGLIPMHNPPVPPTRGLFATLCFTLTDRTGLVQIDSMFIPPINYLLFTTTEPQGYQPRYVSGEFPVLEYWPGDVNFDGVKDVADVVYLLNYIYKGGPIPPHPITADMNGPDRVLDIEDVVYLLNYLYKRGPAPLPGDPW